jgi:hypothetical protein
VGEQKGRKKMDGGDPVVAARNTKVAVDAAFEALNEIEKWRSENEILKMVHLEVRQSLGAGKDGSLVSDHSFEEKKLQMSLSRFIETCSFSLRRTIKVPGTHFETSLLIDCFEEISPALIKLLDLIESSEKLLPEAACAVLTTVRETACDIQELLVPIQDARNSDSEQRDHKKEVEALFDEGQQFIRKATRVTGSSCSMTMVTAFGLSPSVSEAQINGENVKGGIDGFVEAWDELGYGTKGTVDIQIDFDTGLLKMIFQNGAVIRFPRKGTLIKGEWDTETNVVMISISNTLMEMSVSRGDCAYTNFREGTEQSLVTVVWHARSAQYDGSELRISLVSF